MELQSGRAKLRLRELAGGDGPALLILHGLGGGADDWAATDFPWQGSVHALDFSGHGLSGWVHGGGYTPELLAADADAALGVIGDANLVGFGLGAYVALLLAAGRKDRVGGALLLAGPGLDGGGTEPEFNAEFEVVPTAPKARSLRQTPAVDAAARARLGLDMRPVDYAQQFAAAARCLLLCEDGRHRPPWWRAVAEVPGVKRLQNSTLAASLKRFRALIDALPGPN